MNPAHIKWCRELFDSLNDHGVWGLPACGLLFRRQGDELVLFDRMPHMEAMPIDADELHKQQDHMLEETTKHFAAAGITVRKAIQ